MGNKNQLLTFANHTLDLIQLAHGCRSLDVLEGNIVVFASTQDRAQVVKQTFRCLVFLKKSNETSGSKQVRVLLRNTHNHLQILSDVGSKHGVQAFKREFHGELAKVVYQPLFWKRRGLDDDTFDSAGIFIVFTFEVSVTPVMRFQQFETYRARVRRPAFSQSCAMRGLS